MKQIPALNWDIIYRKLTGEDSEELNRLWEKAARENPQYILLLEELQGFFHQADHAENIDVYGTLNRYRQMHLGSAVSVPATISVFRRFWLAAAVAVFLFLFVWISSRFNISPASREMVWKEVMAEPGKAMFFHFDDGTHIRLAPGSRLRYPEHFTAKDRRIFLEGRAFFQVKSDTSRPFFVHSGELVTKVTGTSFEVDTDTARGTHQVALKEGSVELLHQADGISSELLTRLRPGQAFQMKENAGEWKVFPVSAPELEAMAKGGLVFRNIPLFDIAEVLNKQFNVEVKFLHASLKQYRFTAVFPEPDLPYILEALEAGGKIRSTRVQNQILFSPQK